MKTTYCFCFRCCKARGQRFLPRQAASLGEWGLAITMPLVPAAAFVEYLTGNILTFSSFKPTTNGGANGYTLFATYNPTTGAISSVNVSNTGHDIFCPGMSLLFDGRAVITGGDDTDKTSISTSSLNSWVAGPGMQIPKGYQSTQTLSDGRIFNIGGSWSGGHGGKNGEIYDLVANTWTKLAGCLVAPMLTADTGGAFSTDNHGWLFTWTKGSVFQAGPIKAMNWYGTTGDWIPSRGWTSCCRYRFHVW